MAAYDKNIFGPVPSRRLGRSLGVSVVPHKVCSLDCVYCEVGKTRTLTAERKEYIRPADILAEFDAVYPSVADSLDVVTVTAAGEPTLNSSLREIVEGLRSRVRHPLAILTNGTTLDDPEVVQTLLLFDIVVPSLDAVGIDAFLAVNKPAEGLDPQKLAEALIAFSHRFSGTLTIEVLLVKGVNDSCDELKRIADVLSQCRYTMVQLNTVFRPPAYGGTTALSGAELLEAALTLKSYGVRVEPVGNFVRELDGGNEGDISPRILRLVSMRPCSLGDIAAVFGRSAEDVSAMLAPLVADGSVRREEHSGEIFYTAVK